VERGRVTQVEFAVAGVGESRRALREAAGHHENADRLHRATGEADVESFRKSPRRGGAFSLQGYSTTPHVIRIRRGVSRHRFLKLRQIRDRGQRRREHSKNIDTVLHCEAAGLVGTTQQVLSHNPFEILVLALDTVPGAPVRLYRQECEDCIDMTWLDSLTALRSLKLVEDVVVDMIDVFHVLPRL
jgi:hypothetical protein